MAQFASDSFTGTGGTLLETYNSAWTRHTVGSTASIDARISNANRCRGIGSGGGAALYYHSGVPASADYSVSVDVTELSDAMYAAGVCARMSTSANTFYMVRWYGVPSPDVLQVYRFDAGAPVQLGSDFPADFTTSTTRNLRLEVLGTGATVTVNVYIDGNVGTPDITYSDTAANRITTAGKAGFRLGYGGSATPSDTTTLHIDNFSADDVGGSGVTGTLATTNANDTLAASGTTTITGSLATTNANDPLAASGSATIVGSLATTNANDTLEASGTTTVTGSEITANQNDTLSASGTTTIVGVLATTNASDVLSASGIVGSITGTLTYTNANDALVAFGSVGNEDSKEGGDDYPISILEKPRKKTLKEQPNKHLESILEKAVKEVYGDILEEAPKVVKRQAGKIVKPFVTEQKKANIPQPSTIDFEALERDAERVGQLIALYQQQIQKAQMQEDDDLLVLIMEMY